MTSNLPSSNPDSSKPSEGVRNTPIAPTTFERDLASLVAIHSPQFRPHSQEATSTFGVPSQPTGTSVPASERLPLTPVQQDLPKPTAPTTTAKWVPPNFGTNHAKAWAPPTQLSNSADQAPPLPAWAPPIQRVNPSGNAVTSPIKAPTVWTPPKNNVTSADTAKSIPAEPKAPIPTKPHAVESNNGSSSSQGFVKPPVSTSISKPNEMPSTEKLKYSGAAPPNNGTIASVQAGVNPEASGKDLISVSPAVTPATATAAPKPSTGSNASEIIPKSAAVSTPAPDTNFVKPNTTPKPAEKPATASSSASIVNPDSSTVLASAATVPKPSAAPKPTEVSGSAPSDVSKATTVPATAPVPGVASPPVGAPVGKEVSSTLNIKSAETAPPRPEVIEEAKLGVNPTQEKEATDEVSNEDDKVSNPIKKGSKNRSVRFGQVDKDTPPPATVSNAASVPSKPSIKAYPKSAKRTATKDPPKEKATKLAKASVGVPGRSIKSGKVFLLAKDNTDFIPVSDLTEDIVDICSGSHHTLALTASGEVYSWGSNEGKALGREGDEQVPKKVEFGAGIDIVQITAGGAISAALTSSGEVYAWGTFYSKNEMLGFIEKKGQSQETPVKIPGKFPRTNQFISVAAGENHLLVLTAKGKVYVSGDSEFYQLGIRMHLSRGGKAIPQGLYLNALNLKDIVSISAGANHSFAIGKNGEVYGWGSNMHLQCGIEPRHSEKKLELPAFSPYITALSPQKIVSGESHSIILTNSKQVFGVGLHDRGSFTTEDGKHFTGSPIAVPFPGTNVQDIASGPSHCLAYASSDLYQWGYGESPKKVNPIQGHNIFSMTCGQGFSVVIASPSEDYMG